MHFCNGTQTDVEKLYAFHENKHEFPGMIGSIDCTKWSWDQCPQAYRAQFSRGDSGSEPFILLEADYALESATRILVKRDTPDKLQQRSVKCIFKGYPKEPTGYYFYFPPENKIVVA
ncbi:ALP1-like protein isoform X1, partial [Tanacetum coccineum]